LAASQHGKADKSGTASSDLPALLHFQDWLDDGLRPILAAETSIPSLLEVHHHEHHAEPKNGFKKPA
jgi:hypothetical protein